MGQGAATIITPQGGRTPTGLPTCAKPKGPPGRKPGARGLRAEEPQAPRAQT